MFLTPTDLARLTARTRHKAQCRALDSMGVRYLRSPTGAPLVLASEVERLLSGAIPGRERRRELRW